MAKRATLLLRKLVNAPVSARLAGTAVPTRKPFQQLPKCDRTRPPELRPCPDESIKIWPVNKAVGSVERGPTVAILAAYQSADVGSWAAPIIEVTAMRHCIRLVARDVLRVQTSRAAAMSIANGNAADNRKAQRSRWHADCRKYFEGPRD
jgi:hypothetical protein